MVFILTMAKITITRLQTDQVIPNIKTHYNVCNLWNESPPHDYSAKLEKSFTRNWISEFHDKYHTIILDRDDLTWMSQAQAIGMITGMFPKLFTEELLETCSKHESQFVHGHWFVRTDRTSLKDGVHGIGPYSDLRSIIESLVSSRKTHLCFHKEDHSCPIYLIPWKSIEDDKEFRLFVCNNRITAISTQHYSIANKWLSDMSDSQISQLVQKINMYFENHIKHHLEYIGGQYTIDIANILDTFYFIEPNGFGAEYSAGSALFHWIHDSVLYNTNNMIEIRFCQIA